MNFPCCQETFNLLRSTFFESRRPSANFCQLSFLSEDISATSGIFPYGQKKFHELSSLLGDLLSISVNFPCGRETLSYHSSTFPECGTLSVMFRELSV